jgi:hypothetical protein
VLVLGKIDEILSWEKTKEQEKDVRFVELGEYLCEVRAQQYWKIEKLEVERYLTGKDTEPWEIIYFNCTKASYRWWNRRWRQRHSCSAATNHAATVSR